MRSRSSSRPAAVLSIGSYLNIFLHFLFAGRIEVAYSEVKEIFEPCCCPLNGLLFKYCLTFFLFAGQIEAAYSEVKELFEPCCCPLNWLLFKYLFTFFICRSDRSIGPMNRIGREIQCLPHAGFKKKSC